MFPHSSASRRAAGSAGAAGKPPYRPAHGAPQAMFRLRPAVVMEQEAAPDHRKLHREAAALVRAGQVVVVSAAAVGAAPLDLAVVVASAVVLVAAVLAATPTVPEALAVAPALAAEASAAAAGAVSTEVPGAAMLPMTSLAMEVPNLLARQELPPHSHPAALRPVTEPLAEQRSTCVRKVAAPVHPVPAQQVQSVLPSLLTAHRW